MKTTKLGRSELVSTRLAYGCWRIAGNILSAELAPEREAAGRRSVIAAYEAGFTLFDLADVYADGASERILGDALREVPAMRQAILLSSKCGIRKKGDITSDAPYRYDFSSEYLVQSCEQSLARLGVETIDLFQLHRPDYLMDPAEVADAFSRLKQNGKVREFGVSNFKPSQVALLQKACPMPLVVNQVEMSLGHLNAFDDGTLDQCLAETITPLAWSPLGGGWLSSGDPIDLQISDHARKMKLRDAVGLVARERGVSRTVVALAWLLKHPAGIVPIIGTTKPEHIRDAATADALELSREEWYRLLEAARGERLP